MGKLFDLDSSVMRILNRIADLMLLNLVVLFFLIVPFTGGAALTGMHYVLLKMVRGEEPYVIKGFWKSFKENFKQATVLWIIVVVVSCILAVDFWWILANKEMMPRIYFFVMFGLTILLYMFAQYIFPLQSKFVNPIKNTLKNSIMFAVLGLPRTIGMTLVSLIPVILLYFFDMQAFPIILLFGVTVPAYLSAMMYNTLFKRFEPEEPSDEDRPLNDEDDEELQAAIKRMQEARDKK